MNSFSLDTYRQRAEQFVSKLDAEYYRHFSGLKAEFDISSIYADYGDLFQVPVVDELRNRLGPAGGDDRKRLRSLLQLAVEGFIGQATKQEAEEIARNEAALKVEVGSEEIPYRQSAIVQATEASAERRETIEQARLALIEAKLNPLYRTAFEATQSLTKKLGWPSYRAMCEEMRGISFAKLEEQTHAFTESSQGFYEQLTEPAIKNQLGYGFSDLRRSDLAHFLRGAGFDDLFSKEKLVASFNKTLTSLGIDLRSQKNVTLDIEERPNKSPRAFCAPVRVPDEIYLVVPLAGGRDDYFALFHEGGHTEHYAHVPASLPFEFRYLGDNSVTEAFAYLFHHLIENPLWLKSTLGFDASQELEQFAQANKLIYLRRYAAKLRYEIDLHAEGVDLGKMPALYARLLSNAVHVEWPGTTYLADVDSGFYVASYLRAWALEYQLRSHLEREFGDHWFDSRQAGDFLKSIWAYGQRLDADELLYETTGETLDFTVMLEEFASTA